MIMDVLCRSSRPRVLRMGPLSFKTSAIDLYGSVAVCSYTGRTLRRCDVGLLAPFLERKSHKSRSGLDVRRGRRESGCGPTEAVLPSPVGAHSLRGRLLLTPPRPRPSSSSASSGPSRAGRDGSEAPGDASVGIVPTGAPGERPYCRGLLGWARARGLLGSRASGFPLGRASRRV